MDQATVLQLGREAALMMLTLATPLLGVSLVVGLGISLFQAVTQINEMTLSYVPKLLAIGVVLALLAPWMLNQMIRYMSGILNALPALAR
ncbi:MAG: EscS/YscS/HrcS family type III secretion system export apparatus protein [Chloroflexi bacterium RBG_16_57_9]|nr:MAG: EscS/YscS/HrcS family type III secretion system export apparatus protein [Chloroflexi bacterium RBG_16_57_9]